MRYLCLAVALVGCSQPAASVNRDDLAVISGNQAALERRLTKIEETQKKLRDDWKKYLEGDWKLQNLRRDQIADIEHRVNLMEKAAAGRNTTHKP